MLNAKNKEKKKKNVEDTINELKTGDKDLN